MGDEETQTKQEPSWWAFDAAADASPPPDPFGDPVEWPDALAWEQLFESDLRASAADLPSLDLGVDLDATKLEAPPGAGGDADGPPAELHLEPLPESIWAPGGGGDRQADDDTAVAAAAAAIGTFGGGTGTTAVAAPPSPAPSTWAETDAGAVGPGPGRWRRFDIRHGNAVIIALVSVVSLVLLGMFLSVRARNDVPIGTPTGDRVATQGPTTSVTLPPTTATTAAPPPSTISLSDLIPPNAAAPDPNAATAGTGTPATRSTPATTAAPARTSGGGGGSGGSGQPASQPTNTTAAPEPEPAAPEPTSPPASDTTTPTTRRQSTSIPDYSIPTWTMPSIPSSTMPKAGGFPNFSNN